MSKDASAYPIVLTADDDGFVVTFPDLPFGITEGDTEEEARARAVDALETVIIALMLDRQDIPLPSPAKGRPSVVLPPLSAAKVALYRAMREAGVTKAELGRRLGWHPPQIDRLLDLRHASRLDQLDQALRALGRRLVVDVRAA
jgi:antitoxin HicB